MKYIGADLHKRTVSLFVVEGSGSERRVVSRRRLAVLLRRLLERWRNPDANRVDGDERVHHGDSRRV